MTLNLAQLKELERAATAGPWHRIPANKAETPFVLAYGEGDSIASFEPCGPWVSGKQAVADLNLTVALRNAAPELIAQAERVEELEAENLTLVQTLAAEANRLVEEDWKPRISALASDNENLRRVNAELWLENGAEIHRLQDRVTEREEAANERGNEIARLRAALRLFLDDDRFQVAVAGNPHVVPMMIAQARDALAAYDRSEKP